MALAKLFGKPQFQQIPTADGDAAFDPKVVASYGQLFKAVDHDADGRIGGQEGALFLRRSRLDDDVLREVWRWACGGQSASHLELNQWIVACAMVAAAQKGMQPTPAIVVEHSKTLPPAEFYCSNVPIVGDLVQPSEESSNIGIRVAQPSTVASGMGSYVSYVVESSTSLRHFPQTMMTVQRRYSDFEWLHARLCVQFPDIMLPLFPGKRVFGNKDEDFLAERCAALQQYLSDACALPRIATHSFDLVVFLSATADGFKALRAYVDDAETADNPSLLSVRFKPPHCPHSASAYTYALTVQTLTQSSNPAAVSIGHDDQFDELLSGHKHSLQRLTQAADVGSAVETRVLAVCDEFHHLAGALTSLAQAEAAGANAGASVAAAAHAEKAAQAALSDAMAGTPDGVTAQSASSSTDKAAAQAFSAHADSHTKSGSMSQYDSMFSGDLVEHSSAVSTESAVKAKEQRSGNRLRRSSSRAAAAAAALSGGVGGVASPDALGGSDAIAQFGSDLQRMSDLVHDQQTALDRELYSVMRAEQRKEAELAAACERRAAVVSVAKHGLKDLDRKHSNATAVNAKSSSKPEQRAQAAAALELAQVQQSRREQAVTDVTAGVKAEMTRVMFERRALTARQLNEYAQLQAKQARVRSSVWGTLAQNLCGGDEETLQRVAAEVVRNENGYPSSELYAQCSASLPFAAEAAAGEALLPGAASQGAAGTAGSKFSDAASAD